MKKVQSIRISCIALLALLASPTLASTIYFDDGTVGPPIGSFYSGQGITFANASWIVPDQGQYGMCLVDITDDGDNSPYTPTSTSPIVGTFSTPQFTVSILALDVGMAGATLNVYDSAVGGNLLASDTFMGVGLGVGVSHTLVVTAPNIVRFELFQPSPTHLSQNDGVFFDNLTFEVPEPSSSAFFGLFSLMFLRACRAAKPSYSRRLRF